MENIQQPTRDQTDPVITSAKSSSNKKKVCDMIATIEVIFGTRLFAC